jgi:hypothetical protein
VTERLNAGNYGVPEPTAQNPPCPPFSKGGKEGATLPFESDANAVSSFEDDADTVLSFESDTNVVSPFGNDADAVPPFEKGGRRGDL